MTMIVSMLIAPAAAAFSQPLCPTAMELSPSAKLIADEWSAAVAEVGTGPLSSDASLAQRLNLLIELDQVTRANLWRVDKASLETCQKQALETAIGERLRRIDSENTEALKRLLPKEGWFRNSVHGRIVTHGAWLIAQHSPDREFRAYALKMMKERLASDDVDPRDYALTFDRVRLDMRLPQVYGSQAICVAGSLALYPIEKSEEVNERRAKIGWAQTIAETKGDLEIGKPC